MLRPDHLSPPWSVRVYLDLGWGAQVSWILEQIVDLTCGSSRPASYSPAPGRLGSRCACRSASPATSQPKPDKKNLKKMMVAKSTWSMMPRISSRKKKAALAASAGALTTTSTTSSARLTRPSKGPQASLGRIHMYFGCGSHSEILWRKGLDF